MLLSLIVPCYNEQEALPLFYREASAVLASMDCDYELLFINDGSRDGTLAVMKELAAADPRVLYFSFSRNFGKEAAMYAGFCNARGDYIAVMDADLQDPPSPLPEMLKILMSGEYDSVATRRADREGEPPVRSWFARRFYSLINRISDADIVDGARDFRLMTRDMKDAILSMGEYNRFSKGIFGWVGFRTFWMPYKNTERVAGQTKWSFWGLMKYAIDGILSFSQAPLDIASWFGFLMTVQPGVGFTRNDLTTYLESKKIQTRNLFAGNLIKHPAFEQYRENVDYRVPGSLEVSDFIMGHTFWIGVYPGMTEEKLQYMINSIKEFCNR